MEILIGLVIFLIVFGIASFNNDVKREQERTDKLDRDTYARKLLDMRRILDRSTIKDKLMILDYPSKYYIDLSCPLDSVVVDRIQSGPFNHEYVEGAVVINTRTQRAAVLPDQFSSLKDDDILSLIHASVASRLYG